jgi:transcriptional regulator with XRE-family HTH domain
MTTLSASDIAALRIREARTKRGWRVKDLAEQCQKAGVPQITAPVITNLETRRRPGREITAEELLALAWVLEVAPLQLLSPLDDGEVLQVVPGQEMGPLEAAAWMADEDAVIEAVRPAGSGRAEDTERALRFRGNPLTVIRQIRAAVRSLRYHDRLLARPDDPNYNWHKNSVTVVALRLLHLTASLEGLGYTAPPMPDVQEILARHGFPPTLAEWERLVADETREREEGESDGPMP